MVTLFYCNCFLINGRRQAGVGRWDIQDIIIDLDKDTVYSMGNPNNNPFGLPLIRLGGIMV